MNWFFAPHNLRFLSCKALCRFSKLAFFRVLFDTVNGKQLILLFSLMDFSNGCRFPFSFQVGSVLEEVELIFSDVRKREAGRCSGLLREDRKYAQVASTLKCSRSDELGRFFWGVSNYEKVQHRLGIVMYSAEHSAMNRCSLMQRSH